MMDERKSYDEYSGIPIFGLMPDLDWNGIHKLLERIDAWGARDAIVWVTGFITQDFAYTDHRAS